MRVTSKILSIVAAFAFAAPLAACTSGHEPEFGSSQDEIASQELTYTYYDCAHPEVSVGWRFHTKS